MSTINNPLNIKTRSHSSMGGGMIMDENKVPKSSIGMDKKIGGTTGLKSHRGALSDLTNNTHQTTGMATKTVQLSNNNIIMPQPTNTRNNIITRSKSIIDNGASLRNSALISGVLPNANGPVNKVQKRDIQSMEMMNNIPQQPVMIDDVDNDTNMIQEEQMVIDITEVPENIDIYDSHDPQCVGEYVNEIFAYYREKEQIDKIDKDYIKNQYHINERMRAILVDWMMAVHVRFKLLSETFFLSVNIVDRYLAKVMIPVTKLQLVGITAILLACKYEEIYSPQIKDFVHTSDDACTHAEVIDMERQILSTLQFHMSVATPLHFLRRFSKAAGSDSRTHSLSKYLSELSMVEYRMVQFVPSMIAAASIYVARRMTMKSGPYWNVTLEYYTCYKESEILQCAQELKEVRKRADTSNLKATRKKYLSSKLMEVAAIPVVEF
ncbi:hypothetical protein DDB_G0275493 [Dictyostelium discoideum AX4]|uniref:G2/mitotic-specific cyclin-B n=1 Tax=Dictyostelium discoideum TaxID=44689 RepID=CCNB_DICDI|nr:hypothetical protein DDB_G0275493 [Dictyostelium discoideum AX4]P42524.1 RecName: Full=G2/mitotic-specific cyclin-B [Dictyostelium discoideum]AAC46498.1 cyclin b [Dictyostelium discoideum]EAL69497.1 hypothetical protein DDB_G0275493 [Dictyostelium discoideum AX4]|eukprot:XP_643591.1 hypothetical protein DDB_G0275493 [Dictyostelium discoideum AX4]